MAFRVILIVIASGIAGVVAYILSSRVLRRVEHNRFIRR